MSGYLESTVTKPNTHKKVYRLYVIFDEEQQTVTALTQHLQEQTRYNFPYLGEGGVAATQLSE